MYSADCNIKYISSKSLSKSFKMPNQILQHLTAPMGPFYFYRLTLIPAWIGNYIHYPVLDEIIYLLPTFNGATFEVWDLGIDN